MDFDIITLVLLFGIIVVVGIFIAYILKAYVAPKRVEELAEMLKAGQIGPAIKRLQNMLEENDRDPYIHFLLAEAYNMQKDVPQAIMEYKQVIKIGKFGGKVKEEMVRSRLAKIFLANKNYEEAKKEFLILTKLDPTNADNFYQVGKLFNSANLIDKALPYFKQAVKINANHAKSHNEIGMIEYSLNNLAEAKNALTEAVKREPELYNAHYYLGLCLKSQKDYDWAMKEFDISMQDESLVPRAHLAKGLCFMEKDQHPKAMVEFERGLAVAPKSSELEMNLRYFMAANAEKIRDFHVAINNWERIHDVSPKFKDVAEKLKQYEEFRTDDAIKDFMIAPPGKFESTSRQIIEYMNLNIIDMQVVNDSEVRILATEQEGKWRNTKLANRLIYIFRVTEPIQEKIVRQMHEDMRTKNATRGVCMTTSDFTTQAGVFCQSRPIELQGKKEMIQFLRAIA